MAWQRQSIGFLAVDGWMFVLLLPYCVSIFSSSIAVIKEFGPGGPDTVKNSDHKGLNLKQNFIIRR